METGGNVVICEKLKIRSNTVAAMRVCMRHEYINDKCMIYRMSQKLYIKYIFYFLLIFYIYAHDFVFGQFSPRIT
jgi:hypothetical protein